MWNCAAKVVENHVNDVDPDDAFANKDKEELNLVCGQTVEPGADGCCCYHPGLESSGSSSSTIKEE